MGTFEAIEAIETLIFICTVITTVSAALNVVITVAHKATNPGRIQNERIGSLEKNMKTLQQRIANDDRRLSLLKTITDELSSTVSLLDAYVKSNDAKMEKLAVGEMVTQKSILALISHELEADDGSSLITARSELTEYLLKK